MTDDLINTEARQPTLSDLVRVPSKRAHSEFVPRLLRHGRDQHSREQAMVGDGFDLRTTADMGDGVFATRRFSHGETVMVGRIDRELDHNHPHASQVSEHRFVLHGGLVPKVNHSCEPNCGIRLNSSGAHDLIARQPITPGQEITFDYAMRNYAVEHFPAHCRCGSRRCRGRITGWQDLPAQRKADYHGFVAPYLIDIDNRRATTTSTSPTSGEATPQPA